MEDMDGRLASLSPDGLLEHAGADLAKAVFRTANCLLANPGAAEEVTLDVLVALHHRLEELSGEDLEVWLQTLPNWLDHATLNKTKSRTPKKKRHAKRLDELVLLGDQLGSELSADQRNAALIKEVLACLSRRHRFVYVLSSGLGHSNENLAALLATDEPTVIRSKTAVASRLRTFASHTLEQRELLGAMATDDEHNPVHDYVRVNGEPDPQTTARLLRRLASTAGRNSTRSMEMSGDSMFDGGASGFYYGETSAREITTGTEHVPLPPPEPAESDALDAPAPQWPLYLLASVGLLALVALGINSIRISDKLDALDASIAKLGLEVPEEDAGPQRLEPGKFFDLAYDSRVEPSKDSEVELLRSDAKGAELRLMSGSLALHVNSAEGVEWIVHDGRYDISSSGKRFRVTHTGSVPEVEVFEGKVRVSGGLLGSEGVEVTSSTRTLAAVMTARTELPLAALPDDERDANELELDELFARAISLREAEPKEAQDLFRDIEIRGKDNWISERALEQLRTLVTPEERTELAKSYLGRFPDGMYREQFSALRCQTLTLDDEIDSCWSAFISDFPSSLYGPGSHTVAAPAQPSEDVEPDE